MPVLRTLRLVGGGRCLAHHEGRTWMVAGALPGELVDAVAERERARVVEARAVDVVADPHSTREHDPCPHAALCGGCDWPHVGASHGARLKAEMAAGAARSSRHIADIVGAAPVRESPLGYRLRARLHWCPQTSTLGFYRNRTHEPTRITHCRLLSPSLMRALPTLCEALSICCPHAVDVDWLESLDASRRIIALRPAPAGPAEIARAWVPTASLLKGAVEGAHRLGKRGEVEPGWGPHEVTMGLPISLRVPIGAFFQGNRHLVPWLFSRVAELCGPEAVPTWDLHAGVGFLAAASRHASARPLELAETFAPAARAASENLPDARVAVGRSAESLIEQGRPLPQQCLVLADPPRAGLSRKLRKQLIGWRPRRILMLSCDPATWTRDTTDLVSNGYRLDHLELVDLFPSTHHVELVSVLERE